MILGYTGLAVDTEEVAMISRRQHSVNFVFGVLLAMLHHEIALEMVNIQMKFDRLELVMVGFVVANTWLVGESMLTPTFAKPAIGVRRECKRPLASHNADLDLIVLRKASHYSATLGH